MTTLQTCRARLRILLTSTLAGVAWLATAAQAGPVEPPLHLLFSGQNRLVVGTVTEINPPSRIVFKRQEVFGDHADVPELVDLLAEVSSVNGVKLGDRYVFAYAIIKRDKRAPGGVVRDTKSSMILSSLGVEPALFRDTGQLRAILDAADTEEKRDSRSLLDLMLKTLKKGDTQLKDLAAAQIALDADLGKLLDNKDRAFIGKVAGDSGYTTAARSVLLQAAFLFPDLYGAWWLPVTKEVLATTPLDGYPEGAWDPTGLVLLAFGLLENPQVLLPMDSIARWLRSPHALFRERSLALLASKFPGQERKAIEKVLNDPSLNAESRKYLDDQMHRLDRQQAENAGHEQGTE